MDILRGGHARLSSYSPVVTASSLVIGGRTALNAGGTINPSIPSILLHQAIALPSASSLGYEAESDPPGESSETPFGGAERTG